MSIFVAKVFCQILPVFHSSFNTNSFQIRKDFFRIRIQPGNHYSYLCRSLSFPSKPSLAVSAAVSTGPMTPSQDCSRPTSYVYISVFLYKLTDIFVVTMIPMPGPSLATFIWQKWSGVRLRSVHRHHRRSDWSIYRKATDDWSILMFSMEQLVLSLLFYRSEKIFFIF